MGKLAEIKLKPTSSSVEDFINNRRTGGFEYFSLPQ